MIAHRAKQDAEAGNLDSAERGTNMAMGFMIASFVIGVLGTFGRLCQVP